MSEFTRRLHPNSAERSDRRLSRSMESLDEIIRTLETVQLDVGKEKKSSLPAEARGRGLSFLRHILETDKAADQPDGIGKPSKGLSYSKSFSGSRLKPAPVRLIGFKPRQGFADDHFSDEKDRLNHLDIVFPKVPPVVPKRRSSLVIPPLKTPFEIPRSSSKETATASTTSNTFSCTTATTTLPATASAQNSSKNKHFLTGLTSFGTRLQDKKPDKTGDRIGKSASSEGSTHSKNDQMLEDENYSLITRRLTAGAKATLSRLDSQSEDNIEDMVTAKFTNPVNPKPANPRPANLQMSKPARKPDDEFVEAYNDEWDIYRQSNGRLIYHKSRSNEVSFNAPLKVSLQNDTSSKTKMKSPDVFLPRSKGSIFAFGSEIEEDRLSIVRDSIRCSTPINAPPGYTEYYEKDTGFIVYEDNVSETSWHTARDEEGKVYFYTKDGRSEWKLPPIPSKLGPKMLTEASPDSARIHNIPSLKAIREDYVFRRYGKHDKAQPPSARKQRGAWEHIYLALCDSHLLCFTDEKSFQRMGSDDPSCRPDHCIDLSHCHLSRESIGKRPKDCTIRLFSEVHHLDVYFSWDTHEEAQDWYNCIREFVKDYNLKETHRTSTNCPPSPSPSGRSYNSYIGEALSPSSRSAPATPVLPTRSQKPYLGAKPNCPSGHAMEISTPTDFVKASPEELLAKLQQASTGAKWVENPDYHFDDSIQAELQRVKTVRKVNRSGGISKSFRKLFVANSPPSTTSSSDSKQEVGRVPSRRSQFLVKFFEKDKRISKEHLIEKGIYKPEAVFGNFLVNLSDTPTGIPEFLTRCVEKIETMLDTVGIYRINGDAAAVQKLRLEVDNDNYKTLEKTKDVTLLASTLKLFIRELPEPLIPKEVRNELYSVVNEQDKAKIVSACRQAVKLLDHDSASVLEYLLIHLRKVADHPINKMGVRNLATVFSPNLVQTIFETRRPESMISEMELNNIIVELLIEHAFEIFKH